MRAIAIGYHDVNQEKPTQPDLVRPCSAHYALDLSQFQAHVVQLDRPDVRSRVSTIGFRKNWHNETPVFLTFDDGGEGAHTCIADELERHHWRGHFFVTTDWIGSSNFMNRRQIRELHDRGHVIGSHTCSHPPRMSSLSWPALLSEWSRSKEILSDILGAEVKVASVADGYFSPKVAEAAAECGINVLFTSEPTVATADFSGCLVIGRYSIQANSPVDLTSRLAGRSNGARWGQKAMWEFKKAAKTLAGPYYEQTRKRVLRAHRQAGRVK